MKRIRNLLLMLVSIFLFSFSFCVTVNGEEEYVLSYEFVMDDGSRVDDRLLVYLKDDETFASGTFIHLDDLKDENGEYEFKGWNNNDFELYEDTKCIGTWSKIRKGDIKVRFDFVEMSKLDGGNLPEKIRDLIPEDIYVDNIDDLELKKFEDIEGYVFMGWEPGAFYEDGSHLYFGVWRKDKAISTKAIERPDRPADKRITSPGTPVGIPGSGAPHQQLDNEDAYCYEPDVTGYANPTHSYWKINTLKGRAAEIIGMGQINGMPYGAIQAALWNYLKNTSSYTFGSYDTNPKSSKYSANGYECSAAIYATYTTPAGAIQDLIMSGGCTLNDPQGKLKLKKSAANTSFNYLNNAPNNYSLANAVYGVYKDYGCSNQVGTLTTSSDGNSNTLTLSTGTYYVKEKSPSKGFKLDPEVYTCNVTEDNTYTLYCKEEPVKASFDLKLYKENERDRNNTDYLDTAEFTLKYYDCENTNVSNLIPKYTWVFRPIIKDGRAEVIFDQEHFVSGSELFLDNGILSLPLGTFTIEESLAAETFALDTNIYTGRIINNNGTSKINIDSSGRIEVKGKEIIQSEKLQSVTITVQKADEDSLLNEPSGIATFENAEFEVYKLVDNAKEYVGKIITDEKGRGSLKYDLDGLELLPGRYFIKEVKAPDGYVLNNNLFDIEAKILERNTANFEYVIEVKEKVTQITVHKIDSNGEYIEAAMLQLLDDEGNVVFEWTCDGKPMVIKGLAIGKIYKLHEIFTKSIYALADDIDISVHDENNVDIEMIDGIISIKTSARFKENNEKTYVADGIAHIIDTVEYEWLYPGKQYLMKGQLIDKGLNNDTEIVIKEVEKRFVPEDKFGTVEMEYEIDLSDYANHDFVVYEQLYILKDKEELITDEDGSEKTITVETEEYVTEHKDYNDEGQSVHVDKLYKATMVLYKVGNGNYSNKLDGAYYSVKTSRNKTDGTVVNNDLGIHLTGGIFYEDKESFNVTVYKDEQMKEKIKTYNSHYDNHFGKQTVNILDLPEGIYYVEKNGVIRKHEIEKGAIVLHDQIGNSNITYREVKAPNSYHIDHEAYTFSVGYDTSLNRLENYRSNYLIYMPITGVH